MIEELLKQKIYNNNNNLIDNLIDILYIIYAFYFLVYILN